MSPVKLEPPIEVKRIRDEIKALMSCKDSSGKNVGSAKCGIYAFFDYDGEPIYVGQTYEGLSSRVGRHLTGQRSDAVAKHVLDPFEVCDVEVWPFWGLEKLPIEERKERLNAAEFTVFQLLIKKSYFGAILNEGNVVELPKVKLPESTRRRIIPDDIYERRKHSDLRIARRANTIANLAQVISEREVNQGLRQVLHTQAQRLEHLAKQRLDETNDE